MVGRLSLAAASTEPSAELDVDGGIATVPREAVIRRDGAYAVWIVEGDGAGATARLRPVVLGRADRAHVEIREGIALGERVVTGGQFALRDGVSVEIDSANAGEGSGR
jgi:multidrug efflux pump subunit AcrA (membrane-fusion protein)